MITACSILRHNVQPRWIGDLLAAYCHSCGCLYIPEPATPSDAPAPVLPPSRTPARRWLPRAVISPGQG